MAPASNCFFLWNRETPVGGGNIDRIIIASHIRFPRFNGCSVNPNQGRCFCLGLALSSELQCRFLGFLFRNWFSDSWAGTARVYHDEGRVFPVFSGPFRYKKSGLTLDFRPSEAYTEIESQGV